MGEHAKLSEVRLRAILRLRSVQRDVRNHAILAATHAIRFELHGSYCGGHGSPSCFKTRRITTKPFRYEQP